METAFDLKLGKEVKGEDVEYADHPFRCIECRMECFWREGPNIKGHFVHIAGLRNIRWPCSLLTPLTGNGTSIQQQRLQMVPKLKKLLNEEEYMKALERLCRQEEGHLAEVEDFIAQLQKKNHSLEKKNHSLEKDLIRLEDSNHAIVASISTPSDRIWEGDNWSCCNMAIGEAQQEFTAKLVDIIWQNPVIFSMLNDIDYRKQAAIQLVDKVNTGKESGSDL